MAQYHTLLSTAFVYFSSSYFSPCFASRQLAIFVFFLACAFANISYKPPPMPTFLLVSLAALVVNKELVLRNSLWVEDLCFVGYFLAPTSK
jgi:uncharacterized membrane protein